MVIIHNYDNNDEPIFYLFEKIIIGVDKKLILQCILLKSIDFNENYKAYEMDNTLIKKISTFEQCELALVLHNLEK